ncbi:1-acylglycerol-3-phosphate O-acyltransferase [Metarhizium acridum]|nr:1-acylglycerol-3-phosphate O-acyltransferase [Metarhizium acridum]
MSVLVGYLVNFLVGYAAVTIFFYMASLAVPKAGFVARALAAYISLLICAVFGVLASIFFTLIGKQGISQWATARAFHYVMRLTTGIVFQVEDPGNILATTRPAVFIGNHQTELDVLMLGAMFPKWCSVTAKSDLKHIPFLGWFMRLSGSIFIDRKNSKDAREAMAGAAKEIQTRQQSVYMFPEGTRSYAKDPVLLPFKKGAFHPRRASRRAHCARRRRKLQPRPSHQEHGVPRRNRPHQGYAPIPPAETRKKHLYPCLTDSHL